MPLTRKHKRKSRSNRAAASPDPAPLGLAPAEPITRWLNPEDDLEARIGTILRAIQEAEGGRAHALLVNLFERLAECDPITRAAYKPRIVKSLGIPVATYREMLRAALDARALRERAAAGRASYAVRDGRICRLEFDPVTGQELALPLCNFDARIVEETELDEGGGEIEREYGVEGTLAGGERLPPLIVPADEYEGMHWLEALWGLSARIHAAPANRDQLREAILHLSQGCPTRAVYAHTGWRKHAGTHLFLHAAGALGDSSVSVEVDPALSRYRLPANPDRLRDGLAASLRLLELGNGKSASTLITLWAAMYLAPLGAFIPLDFCIWLYGATGTLKSTLLALALSHYGDFDRTNLPANWESTANALEKLLFLAKDIPVAIDDFAPQANLHQHRELEHKAARLIRATGNRAGRGRLKADASLGQTYYPRGLVLVTGEQLPSGQSILARTLPVEMGRDAIDLARLTLAQRQASLLPHAMSGYILWLAAHYDELAQTLPARWLARREQLTGQAHLRLPEMYASLSLSLDLALTFAQEQQAITADRAGAIRRSARAAWSDLTGKQGQRINRERPTYQFLETLQEQLMRGTVYLLPLNSLPPSTPPGAGHIGWEDDDYYYLLPKVSYQRASAYCNRTGITLVKPNTLYRQLYEEGFLETDPEGERVTMVKWTGKGAHRILQISKTAVANAISAGVSAAPDEPPADDENA